MRTLTVFASALVLSASSLIAAPSSEDQRDGVQVSVILTVSASQAKDLCADMKRANPQNEAKLKQVITEAEKGTATSYELLQAYVLASSDGALHEVCTGYEAYQHEVEKARAASTI